MLTLKFLKGKPLLLLMLHVVLQDESKITKFQTGGPDGDLGSNEILVSKDNTVAP